jgi:putative ABC transport system substrate-binding protein
LITNNSNGLKNVNGFIGGMEEYGYLESENTTYLFSGEPTANSNLDSEIQQMIAAGADLIFTAGTPTGVAAYQATMDSEIPVVFGVVADPIAAGIMDDLNHPGGNMTGVMLSKNQSRRVELLLELDPSIKKILIPFNPEDTAPQSALVQIADLCKSLNVEIVERHARSAEDAKEILQNIPADIDAVFLLPDSVFNPQIESVLAAANELGVPVSGPSTIQAEQGAVISYGIIHQKVGVQAARIAHQILQGIDPGDIPVEVAEFYLAINVDAAEKIELEIPYYLLQQAEFVITPDK